MGNLRGSQLPKRWNSLDELIRHFMDARFPSFKDKDSRG